MRYRIGHEPPLHFYRFNHLNLYCSAIPIPLLTRLPIHAYWGYMPTRKAKTLSATIRNVYRRLIDETVRTVLELKRTPRMTADKRWFLRLQLRIVIGNAIRVAYRLGFQAGKQTARKESEI